ncbi:MAG: AbrB/MazE/SpoVT family DNA-binding domain-containing protein [Candidatus Diapherotrites archaeon]
MTDVAIVTVSEKGQIALPKKTRERWGIHKGDKLLLLENKGKIVLAPVKGSKEAADVDEMQWIMGVSAQVLKEDWDYKGDDVWDEL